MIKILFIKVNPKGTTNLFLDVEENNIESARVASANRDYFEIKSKGAVTKDMLHSDLESYKPDILHISGHGSEEGVLYFHDEENYKKEVSIEMFSEFIQNYKPHLKCVFMNACFSLMKTSDFKVTKDQAIIGMNTEVPNDTASTFSKAFYTSFFEGKSINDAFKTAIDVVGIEGFGEESIPVLLGNTDLQFGQNTDEASVLTIIPEENFAIARTKSKKRKRDFHILIAVTVLASIGLVATSLLNDQDTLFTLVGIMPLGLIKWIKDKLDGIEKSLSLLEMLENDISAFLERLKTPPIPNADETVTNIKQQFWDIVK